MNAKDAKVRKYLFVVAFCAHTRRLEPVEHQLRF